MNISLQTIMWFKIFLSNITNFKQIDLSYQWNPN